VAYPGLDHRLHALRPEPERPRHLAELDQPFLLVLGTDYRHKNRIFALRLLDELRRRHSWPGALVFAGPHIPYGSSAGEEAEFLMTRPELAPLVVEVAAVTEAEKRWLFEQTAAVLYPTVYEGFGLVPFEAAAAGAPCLFAPHTSLSEVLPSELARLVPWDAAASADRVIDVLQGAARDELVEQLRTASAPYTWRRCAEQTIEVYERAVSAPSRGPLPEPVDMAELEEWARELEARHLELVGALGDDGMSLVGPSGVLPDNMRRPLLAIAVRRWLRVPIFGLLRLPYTIVHRLSRGGGS
jgi:hypothetical protein